MTGGFTALVVETGGTLEGRVVPGGLVAEVVAGNIVEVCAGDGVEVTDGDGVPTVLLLRHADKKNSINNADTVKNIIFLSWIPGLADINTILKGAGLTSGMIK
jgi:hypothetical protein